MTGTFDLAAGKSSGVLFPNEIIDALSDYSKSGYSNFYPEKEREAASWVDFLLPIREEEMSYRNTEILFPDLTEAFVPRTMLGRKLLSLRNRAIQRGMKLLSADEVLEEVRRRRGEIDDNETDVY